MYKFKVKIGFEIHFEPNLRQIIGFEIPKRRVGKGLCVL